MHEALRYLFAKYRILAPVLDAATKKAIFSEMERGASALFRYVLSTIGRPNEEIDKEPHCPELKGAPKLIRRQLSKILGDST